MSNTTLNVKHVFSDSCKSNRLLASLLVLLGIVFTGWNSSADAAEAQIQAGVAKVDITNTEKGLVNDRLYVKALVLKNGSTTVTIITVDAVAIARIGSIRDDYLAKVRAKVLKELKIKPKHIIINASHCHGLVCKDIEARTFQAVKKAMANMVPVTVGAGTGKEDRIMENRRLKLKNGREVDVRHAYSLAPDEDIASVGPVDSEIGILRLDKNNGETLAVVYNFDVIPFREFPTVGTRPTSPALHPA